MTPEVRLQAEQACARLIIRFAILADEGRFGDLSRLFAADAQFNRPSEPNRILRGRKAILDDFAGKPHVISAHLALNIDVDVVDENQALAVSYIVAMSGPGPPGSTVPARLHNAPIRVGCFSDQFQRVDGTWLISQRVGRMLLLAETSG